MQASFSEHSEESYGILATTPFLFCCLLLSLSPYHALCPTPSLSICPESCRGGWEDHGSGLPPSGATCTPIAVVLGHDARIVHVCLPAT